MEPDRGAHPLLDLVLVLLLLALGRTVTDDRRLIPYTEIEEPLAELLIEFGSPRARVHPNYPYWRLQGDGVWNVAGLEDAGYPLNSDPPIADLRRSEGGLTPDVWSAVRADPDFRRDLARLLLDENFPPTYHEDIAVAVGLDLSAAPAALERDPTFRRRILIAYGFQCAVCGFNVRLHHAPVALEAAHIKWHQAGGPSEEPNGLALCTMHHKLFDRGAFTVTADRRVQVSELANGTVGLEEWLLAYRDRPLREPVSRDYVPLEEYVRWHVREVFKGSARG